MLNADRGVFAHRIDRQLRRQGAEARRTGPAGNRRISSLEREGRAGYLFIAPTAVLLSVFYLVPLGQTIAYSFTNWDPSGGVTTEFVGGSNFGNLFSTAGFSEALLHTGIFVITVVPVTIALGLVLAVLLDKPFRGRSVYRTLIFAPFVAPTVGSALVFSYLLTPFGGIVNSVLGLFGIQPVGFLASSPWALIAVIVFSIWHEVGYIMLVFSAALSAIPASYHEAATLDGAGSIRRFFAISVPLVAPTTAFLSVTGVLGALQVFTQIQVLTQGGPLGSTTTALYWIYQEGFSYFHGGLATAGAVVLLLIGVLLTFIQLKVVGRQDTIEMI